MYAEAISGNFTLTGLLVNAKISSMEVVEAMTINSILKKNANKLVVNIKLNVL